MAGETNQVISKELEAGESLLWAGQPRRGIVFRSSDLFAIPFSILWGGFALFWEAGVILEARRHTGNAPPLLFELFGIPFVVIGLYMMIGRFIVDARRRGHTSYGVTDRRVIIVTGLQRGESSLDLITMLCVALGVIRHEVKSLDLSTLSDVTMSEGGDGSGTITFGPQGPWNPFGNSGLPGSSAVTPCFELIPQVKSVYQQIREAQRRAS